MLWFNVINKAEHLSPGRPDPDSTSLWDFLCRKCCDESHLTSDLEALMTVMEVCVCGWNTY